MQIKDACFGKKSSLELLKIQIKNQNLIYNQQLNAVRMKIWIEVASGDWAWVQKTQQFTQTHKRGLKAPASTRYFNLFNKIEPQDILLTYLTQSLTSKKEWRSAIVGISTIKNSYYQDGNTLFIDTMTDLELPVPIAFSEFKDAKSFSDTFDQLLRLNMQKYISEILKQDFVALLKIHKENTGFIKKTSYSFLFH